MYCVHGWAFQVGDYKTLFTKALNRYGILCLGLYRSISQRPSACNYNRYVLTNPPAESSEVRPHDKVRTAATIRGTCIRQTGAQKCP